MRRWTIVIVVAGGLLFAAGVIARPFLSALFCRLRTGIAGATTPAGDVPFDPAHYARKSSYYAGLGRTQKIVFLGDSRVEWGEWAEMLGRCDVSNRGISGDTSGGVLRRIRSSVPSDHGLCVIQAGVNDLTKGSAPDAVIANYRKILAYLIEERRSHPVVTSVILAGEKWEALNRKIAECNRGLSQLSLSMNAEWLDLNGSLSPRGFLAPEYTEDGVHLNQRGYGEIGRLLAPSLSR